MQRFYRVERIGRRIVLQLFSASAEYAPCCTSWDRVPAKLLKSAERELSARGILPLSDYPACFVDDAK